MNIIHAEINNFNKTELCCKCGCGLFNYNDNFLIRLQAFRLLIKSPLIVTSGGRCINHNKNVGGVSTSLHICEGKKASAVDVTSASSRDIYSQAAKSRLFNEVIWYQGENFVHLGYDDHQINGFSNIK